MHDVYPALSTSNPLNFNRLDTHIPSGAKFYAGTSISLEKDKQGNFEKAHSEVSNRIRDENRKIRASGLVLPIFKEKARIDGSCSVWFDIDSSYRLDDTNMQFLWQALTDRSGGGRDQHWYPESLRLLKPNFRKIKAELIPAMRQVGKKGSTSENYSGEGLIERLAKLQNPDAYNQNDRLKFKHINSFLRNVTDNATAEIEIPHERDTILVHMDEKVLPLESLGTGIHQVIILASAATIPDKTVVCIEEPELHLNPVLQKKLIRYLVDVTSNQYFITTHSAALMDTPGIEIYHVNLEKGQSIVNRVTSDTHKSAICENLGYHPSDLLQSNCIIWVEGPSDRLYIKNWINSSSPSFIEGLHYSIMFYGGRLASHLSGEDIDNRDKHIEEFISLRRLNRRSVIVMDSDLSNADDAINSTKERLKKEFDKGPGYAWVTTGREIENYLSADQLKEAIKKTRPSARATSEFGMYDNCLSIKLKNGKESAASKVEVAKYISDNFSTDLSILNLKNQIEKLVSFIAESNPAIHFHPDNLAQGPARLGIDKDITTA
jgi:predicted ATPase